MLATRLTVSGYLDVLTGTPFNLWISDNANPVSAFLFTFPSSAYINDDYYMTLVETAYFQMVIFTVLDLVTQVRDVVFVKCIFSFGEPQGVSISE